VHQLKPKFTSARLDDIVYSILIKKVEEKNISLEEFHCILQGLRNKKSKDLYLKLRQMLIDHKDSFFPKPTQGSKKEWAEKLINGLFSFASNMPSKYGVYHNIAMEAREEILAHYQEDIYEACKEADGEMVTRLA
jgi:hypothetical protein